VLDHVRLGDMWPSASIGEQSAGHDAESAANAAAPGPKRSGMRGRSAAHPRT
jgi:hypothetical protein